MKSAARGAPSAASLAAKPASAVARATRRCRRRAAAGLPAGSCDVGVRRAVDERQRARRIEADAARAPAPVAEHPLRDRQRVEEFVGDDDDRACAGLDARRSSAAERRRRPASRAGSASSAALLSIELDAQRRAKRRNEARRAQRIAHQRAASRAQLDQPHRPAALPSAARRRRTTGRPARRTPG